MPAVEIRPFTRADRDQLTELVNAHVGVLLPGVSVSVNTVLSQLEREPGEYVVDPWAVDRAMRVAVVRDRTCGSCTWSRACAAAGWPRGSSATPRTGCGWRAD